MSICEKQTVVCCPTFKKKTTKQSEGEGERNVTEHRVEANKRLNEREEAQVERTKHRK